MNYSSYVNLDGTIYFTRTRGTTVTLRKIKSDGKIPHKVTYRLSRAEYGATLLLHAKAGRAKTGRTLEEVLAL